MTAEERAAKIAELEGKCWVRLPSSKWFRLLDHVKAPKEYAPSDPVRDNKVRWVPVWVAAICENGPGWAGISQLIEYVIDQDDDFRSALTAQCVANPEGVVGFIRDSVVIAEADKEWIGDGAEESEDDDTSNWSAFFKDRTANTRKLISQTDPGRDNDAD